MTEVRIFELLDGVVSENDFTRENPRLNPNNTRILSKYIADTIYSTKTSKKTTDLNRRLDLFKLVQEWGHSYAKPFKVTPNNYGCLLKCLDATLKSDVRDGDHFNEGTPNIGGAPNEPPTTSLRNEILHFNKLRCLKKTKREKSKTFVRDFDCELLCERKLYQPLPNVRAVDDCAPFIERLFHEETDNGRSIDLDTAKTDLVLEKQMATICALVNLGRTPTHVLVLEKLLGDLAKADVLKAHQKEFVWHLWKKNGDILGDGLLLRCFKFLYEIIGIGACKKLLQDPEYVLADDSELWRIKVAVTDNTHLRMDLKNMFYELFALSCHNENLLPVLDFF